jgi:hypothetical protein
VTADIVWVSGRITRVHNYSAQHLKDLALERSVDHVMILCASTAKIEAQ